MIARLLTAIGLMVAVACSGAAQQAPPPTAGVNAYLAALRSDDPKPAWSLLSEQVRASMTYDEFAAAWRSSERERERQAQQLEAGLRGTPRVPQRALVRYRDGKAVRLQDAGQGWRLDAALVSRTVAHNPLDAVDIFARAIEGRDFQAVLSILTTRRREGINRFITEFADSLRKHTGDEGITFQGKNRAELKWDEGGTRYKVILIREGDEWRVDDFDIVPAPTAE